MLWLSASLIVAACLIESIGILAKVRTNQLRQQETCRDAFYRYADRLTADPETPEEVIKLIYWLLPQVTSRAFLWSFLINLAKGKVRGRRSDSLEMIKKVPEHLRPDYVGLLVSFIFGLTYNNMVLGWLIRRFILYSIPHTNSGDIGPVTPLCPMVDGFSRQQPRAAHPA